MSDFEYREVCGLCMDQTGAAQGSAFPETINQLPWRDAWRACAATGGEHFGCMRVDVLKGHPFPEPEGVKFVTESILWDRLAAEGYRTWFFNEALRIQHKEGTDHLSGVGGSKKSIQACADSMWNNAQILNEWGIHKGFQFKYLKVALTWGMNRVILKKKSHAFPLQSEFASARDRAFEACISPLSHLAAYVYMRKRM